MAGKKMGRSTAMGVTPLPLPDIAKRQKRRKYYIMRQLSFQAIPATKSTVIE